MAKGRWRWWKILLLLFGLGLLLVIIAIPAIKSRAEVAWKNYQAKWQSDDPFDLEAYLPPNVPADENLAMHPLFDGWATEGSHADLWLKQIDSDRVFETSGRLWKSRRGLLIPSDISKLGELDESLSVPERARELLALYQPVSELMDQVAEALAERPFAHFPIAWEDGLIMDSPHLFAALKIADSFRLRATLRSYTGDAAGAAADIIGTLRLGHAIGQDPVLIAFLVESSIQMAAIEVLWDVLARHEFREEDLASIEEELSGIEAHGKRVLTVIRIERAFLLSLLDDIQNGVHAGGRSADHKPLARYWLSANRLAICKDFHASILAPDGVLAGRASLEGAQRYRDLQEERRKGIKKFIFALSMVSASMDGVVEKSLQVEAELANARIAVALERYRLSHGSYPAHLRQLSPAFLGEIPTDLINQRPVEYRLKTDGTPLIYQWGFNGQDDGGLPRREPEVGDFVWQYSSAAPIKEREWRSKN